MTFLSIFYYLSKYQQIYSHRIESKFPDLLLDHLCIVQHSLNRWVDNIYDKGIPEDTKHQHTTVDGKLYLKMHTVFMSDKDEEGKSDFFMTVEQIEGDE